MSLLDSGTEIITVYPQIRTTDPDGNPIVRTSDEGVQVSARIQPMSTSEDWDQGFQTEERYRMFIARSQDTIDIGIAGQVEWQGVRWEVDALPRLQTGSPRTRHNTYYLRRV